MSSPRVDIEKVGSESERIATFTDDDYRQDRRTIDDHPWCFFWFDNS